MPKGAVVLAPDLHSVHKNCGIDSDAGISISTLREVFMWIDDSRETTESIQSPSGINGGPREVPDRTRCCLLAERRESVFPGDVDATTEGTWGIVGWLFQWDSH